MGSVALVLIAVLLTVGIDDTEPYDQMAIAIEANSTAVLSTINADLGYPDTDALSRLVDSEWASPTDALLDLDTTGQSQG